MILQSPLGRVLGRGAAKEGVHHWWVQRLTSVALVPLGLWFVASLAMLPLADHGAVAAWIHEGWTAPLLVLFTLLGAWHSQLGVRVVLEDYVHAPGARTVVLILSTFIHVLLAGAGLFAVLRVAFGAAP